MTLEEIDVAEIQPDPAWDYYVLWHEIQKVRHNFQVLTDFISQQEQAVEETDDIILEKLTSLVEELTDIRDRR